MSWPSKGFSKVVGTPNTPHVDPIRGKTEVVGGQKHTTSGGVYDGATPRTDPNKLGGDNPSTAVTHLRKAMTEDV
jgi:hypothetical protein